jgi:hypothetical protein
LYTQLKAHCINPWTSIVTAADANHENQLAGIKAHVWFAAVKLGSVSYWIQGNEKKLSPIGDPGQDASKERWKRVGLRLKGREEQHWQTFVAAAITSQGPFTPLFF